SPRLILPRALLVRPELSPGRCPIARVTSGSGGCEGSLVLHAARRAVAPAQGRIAERHFGDQELGRDVVEGAVHYLVAHEGTPLAVIGLQQRVAAAIEIQRRHTEAVAQGRIEGRTRPDPAVAKLDLGEAVPG